MLVLPKHVLVVNNASIAAAPIKECVWPHSNPPACDVLLADRYSSFDIFHVIYAVLSFGLSFVTLVQLFRVARAKQGWWPGRMEPQQLLHYFVFSCGLSLLAKAADPFGWRGIIPQEAVIIFTDLGSAALYSCCSVIAFVLVTLLLAISGTNYKTLKKVRRRSMLIHIPIWVSAVIVSFGEAFSGPSWHWKMARDCLHTSFLIAIIGSVWSSVVQVRAQLSDMNTVVAAALNSTPDDSLRKQIRQQEDARLERSSFLRSRADSAIYAVSDISGTPRAQSSHPMNINGPAFSHVSDLANEPSAKINVGGHGGVVNGIADSVSGVDGGSTIGAEGTRPEIRPQNNGSLKQLAEKASGLQRTETPTHRGSARGSMLDPAGQARMNAKQAQKSKRNAFDKIFRLIIAGTVLISAACARQMMNLQETLDIQDDAHDNPLPPPVGGPWLYSGRDFVQLFSMCFMLWWFRNVSETNDHRKQKRKTMMPNVQQSEIAVHRESVSVIAARARDKYRLLKERKLRLSLMQGQPRRSLIQNPAQFSASHRIEDSRNHSISTQDPPPGLGLPVENHRDSLSVVDHPDPLPGAVRR